METQYQKLIGKDEHGDYIFLDYTFNRDGFKGATGWTLTAINVQQYDYDTSPKQLQERFRDIWQQVVANGQTEESLETFAQKVYDEDGDESLYDYSYYEYWEPLRELGLKEEEYPVFTCNSCGRIFGSNLVLVEVYEPEILKCIEAVEEIKITVQPS